MKIEVHPDATAVACRSVDVICSALRARPDAWLGLPTGKTPVLTYAELKARTSTASCDMNRTTACAVDEFCAPSENVGTNAAFYAEHLPFCGNLRSPSAAAPDPLSEIKRFASAIREHGGLDLCLLGIGVNGHIAFNEPGSPRDSRARVVDLAATTVRAHAEGFGGEDNVPRQGMTLGVADILESKSLLVLATGASKAAIVAAAIQGPVTADVPASWLRGHADVTWMLDQTAAAGLNHAQRG